MDIKFRNKLMCIVLVFLSSISFLMFSEDTTDYRKDKNSYVLAEGDLQDQVARCAKNLERQYVYYKNFDIDKAYKRIDDLNTLIQEKRQKQSETSSKNVKNNNYTITNEDGSVEIYSNNIDNSDNYSITNKDSSVDASSDNSDNSEYSKARLNALSNPNSDYVQVTEYDENDDMPKITVNSEDSEYVINYAEVERIKPETLYEESLAKKDLIELEQLYDELLATIDNYENINNYLKETDFVYEINSNGKTFSNSTNFEKVSPLEVVPLDSNIFENTYFNGGVLSRTFKINKITGKIVIPNDLSDDTLIGRYIKTSERLYLYRKVINVGKYVVLGITILFALFMLIFERKETLAIIQKLDKFYAKQPFLLKLVAVGLFSIFIFKTIRAESWMHAYYLAKGSYDSYAELIFNAILLMFFFTYYFLGIFNLAKTIRHPKQIINETEIKFIKMIARDMKHIYLSNNKMGMYLYWVDIICLCILLIAEFCCFCQIGPSLNYLIIFAAGIPYWVAGYFGLKLIGNYSRQCIYINEMAKGNIEEIPFESGTFTNSTNQLNQIKNGIKLSMEDMLKNERLKAELITNVSHDLKTPLTSVISYVQLLKELKLNNSKADEYIDVLEQKSGRLKILIDDLFEASKLSTGQLKLEKDNVDIIALLRQSLGELESKIDSSNINFITNIPQNPIILNIDGRRMWRVFDNLINNILKYSLQNTRAYIDIVDSDKKIDIVFKNISATEMNFSPDELFERFKRGESSRTTEGSGLGLSIARSIVELHNGEMKIDVDGDLFKVVVTLQKDLPIEKPSTNLDKPDKNDTINNN